MNDIKPTRCCNIRARIVPGMLMLLLIAAPLPAAEITIVNNDQPGEGFNDPSPRDPVGNNPETTLGEQRMFAVQAVADQWGALLESDVEILVETQWPELTCEPNTAVLGSAGPAFIDRDFPNAPEAGTWYHIALANSLAGVRIGGDLDIVMNLNARLDDGDSDCLGGTTWYYGLDGNPPSGTLDVVPLVLHELAHGLGFSNFANLDSGELLMGSPDIYMLHIRDTEAGKDWTEMTDAERAASAENDPNVVWTGPEVTAMAPNFVTSSDAFSDGFLRLHAPDPLRTGSSISHWTNDASPRLLMQPSLSSSLFDQVDLTVDLFDDIGWLLNFEVIFSDKFEAP